MGFSFVAQKALNRRGNGSMLAFFCCNKCEGGLIVEYTLVAFHNYNDVANVPGDPAEFGFRQNQIYPKSPPMKLPPHTPKPLDRYYEQAFNGLRRGDFDASGAMSGKILDISTKMLLGDEAKKYNNIQRRIDAVADKGIITSDLKDWAHQIRIGRNEAAHDEEPYAKEEAEDLLSFAELYLTYVYTLPGQLAARKARKAGAPNAPGTVNAP